MPFFVTGSNEQRTIHVGLKILVLRNLRTNVMTVCLLSARSFVTGSHEQRTIHVGLKMLVLRNLRKNVMTVCLLSARPLLYSYTS